MPTNTLSAALPDIAVAPPTIGIVGLGYVGLPLAVEFGKHFPTIGFDIHASRIAELSRGYDRTLEVAGEELKSARNLRYSVAPQALEACDFFIITVPTPVDAHNHPDLTPVRRATETVGTLLKRGDIVVYESTVYPGCTEEVCVPILEDKSGLRFNTDFFVGYSPERINPGDKLHRLSTITKITSGSTPEAAQRIDQIYRHIITAGTYRASSIKVAEAAKVIENTQRDLNIALMNELSLIFRKIGIDTEEVLKAAGTKWNFLPFRPGLVGGHCIGVDPYYLTYKAQAVGYNPEVILAGRRINDAMGAHIATDLVKLMVNKGMTVKDARVLIMGLTFKENCPDLRNSKVIDILKELRTYGIEADVYEPWASTTEVQHEYGLSPVESPQAATYDAIVIAVAHEKFRVLGLEAIRALARTSHVLYDVKGLFPLGTADGRL